jgi:hypothetical protein
MHQGIMCTRYTPFNNNIMSMIDPNWYMISITLVVCHPKLTHTTCNITLIDSKTVHGNSMYK